MTEYAPTTQRTSAHFVPLAIAAIEFAVCCLAALPSVQAGVTITLFPNKDGTLVDGGIFGPFDGIADQADWTFNESSYEGSITLSTASPASSLEHRVVWEYDLRSVTLEPPIEAELAFTIRGAPIFPFPDVHVVVFRYPSDLLETLADFHMGPAVLQGGVTVVPFQPPTDYTLDVSAAVNDALATGTDKVAFRFQIDPDTPEPASQAFIDALDSDPTTKPMLVVSEAVIPGDVDEDGDVDLDDYAGFPACHAGPGVVVAGPCTAYDFDLDADVDAADYGHFQTYFTAPSQ